MCAQTAIAHIDVLLHQSDARPTYDLYVPAAYALDFVAWLSSSAAEFGYRIGGSSAVANGRSDASHEA